MASAAQPESLLFFDVPGGVFVVSIPAGVVERGVLRWMGRGKVIRALRDLASLSESHPASAVMERVLLSLPVLVLHPRPDIVLCECSSDRDGYFDKNCD
jgi:hypothetical protein